MGRRLRICATALASTLALTVGACGNDTNNDAALSSTAVDISKLDSGNYPTTPSDVEKTRTDDSGAVREAIRIGAAIPLVMDVDNRFIFDYHTYISRMLTPRSKPNFTGTKLESEEFNTIAPGLVAGWYTLGQRREESGLGREIEMDAIRFSSSDRANAAAQALADRTLGEGYRIAEYPAARTTYVPKVPYGSPRMASWLAHDDMLLYVRVDDPVSIPFNPAEQADFVKRAFDKLVDGLKGYSPTPIDQIKSLPLDVDGLLSRTLPFDKDNRPGGSDPSAVYPKRAAMHFERHPNLAMAAFDDAGVDNIAVSATAIYRTRDISSTTRLIAALEAPVIDEENYAKVDSPTNLATAHCYNAKPGISSASNYPPVCWIAFDRYVAKVNGRNVQDLHQRTAAQYKLLASGR
ncbi:hypothetical protein OG874_40580 [Nocardia sp. NBC_00565]|uniref:DUF7373 family lipoprotein n=1 Tax=Nocardia sp. NBC_00565 TaxID=2975993 RepID=UPI002E807889|nr:hypothetical protein [Nocardia sp. NBC_00565]WUC02923.1 hypothetical protein OG874_40580 [Nocardia sp. NBC_00565]